MAKLTARFDLEDRISKKLRTISGKIDSVEKSRSRLNKPMVLKVRDEATKKLMRVHKFVLRDISKTHKMVIAIRDQATKPLKKLDYFIRRRMPKTHNFIVKAQDRAKSVLEKINRYMGRKLTGIRYFTIMAKDKAMPLLHKIANYGKRALSKGYSFSVRAIDIATKTVGRIASFARTALPKYRDFTIRAINGASRVIGTIKRALFSIPTLITVTLAVVGVGKLSSATVGAAMDFEGYEVATKHWLGGDEKESNKLIEWMRNYTNKTPFDSPDLFPALSRGIGIADGDVGEAKGLLKIATDMASLSGGTRSVADAMEAIGNAKMGEFTMLSQGFNLDMNKEKFGSIGGWSGLMAEMKSEFEGGAEEFSETARGKINKIKGYITGSFREAGDGILESMKPRLDSISTWIDNNQDKWMEWRDTVQQAGAQGSEWVFSKLENGFNHIRVNYLENDKFKKLDFEGKVKFIMDDLGKWWDKTGLPWVSEVGMTLGKSITKGIVWGAKEGFKGIGNLWKDALKDPSVGSFATAGIATAIGMSVVSLLASPLIKAFRIGGSIISGALSAGKWIGGLFGKGKGPKTPGGPISGRKSPETPKQPKQKKPNYRQPWFNKGDKPVLNTPNKKGPKIPKGLSKSLNKLGNFGKRIPVLGTLLGGLAIATSSKEDMAGTVGGVGGGIGGAMGGAAIGSAVFPGVGTIIGGILGGLGGGALGQKIGDAIDFDSIKEKFTGLKDSISQTLFNGDWWAEKWQSVTDWTAEKLEPLSNTWNTVKDGISNTLFNSEWWGEKWDGVKEIGSKLSDPGWWAEQAGFIWGYLEETIFSGDWWSGHWETIKDITAGTIFDGEWWSAKWENVKTWTSEKWESAQEIWDKVSTAISNTILNGEWWSEKWDSVMDWTSNKWESAQEIWNRVSTAISDTILNGEWWQGKWDSVMEWTSNRWEGAQEIWDNVKTSLDETLFDGEWWKGKWNNVLDWGKGIMGGIGGWVSGLIEDTKESFGSGREKGKKAATPPGLARGTNFHSGGPAILGDGGGSELIRYPNGGMSLSPSTDTLMNLPRGTRVLPHQETKELMNRGIPAYAKGIGFGGAKDSQINASVGVDSIAGSKLDTQGDNIGQTFSKSIENGVNSNVISLNQWKERNIQTPMQNVIGEAVGFGSGMIDSFANGQNATATNTAAHLDNQVRLPFKVIRGGASQWGSGTISGFRTGQNATATGTKPYLVSNVHTPFDETKAKGNGWGSGLASEFISGLRSKGEQVKEASKYLAEQVEKTFRSELGIHSPSKVMMLLGKFASIGIVKGLGAVDVRKFAESQAGSLAAAFSGMGSIGGNMQEWLMAAMMATGTPLSWLGPLGVIAQKESGGNPRAQNNWDSNAKAGIPSKGLMQTIGPTFNANKGKGMNDIFNPIHNAVAAINYIKGRYGSVFNVPGIKSMATGGAYEGYYKGTNGPLRKEKTAWVGEHGPELMSLQRGTEVFSHEDSMDMVSGKSLPDDQMSAVVSTSRKRKGKSIVSKARDIIVQITGDNHYHDDMDAERVGNIAVKAVKKALEHEYNEGGEMVVYE